MIWVLSIAIVALGAYIGLEALDRWLDRVGTLPPDEELGLDVEETEPSRESDKPEAP